MSRNQNNWEGGVVVRFKVNLLGTLSRVLLRTQHHSVLLLLLTTACWKHKHVLKLLIAKLLVLPHVLNTIKYNIYIIMSLSQSN